MIQIPPQLLLDPGGQVFKAVRGRVVNLEQLDCGKVTNDTVNLWMQGKPMQLSQLSLQF